MLPLPSTSDVGAIMHELKSANRGKKKGKKRSRKQMIAIALSEARKHGYRG